MIAAGLVAKKAVEKGLTVKPWVKPRSRQVRRSFSITSQRRPDALSRQIEIQFSRLWLHYLHWQQRSAA
jgi:hypothetical protein